MFLAFKIICESLCAFGVIFQTVSNSSSILIDYVFAIKERPLATNFAFIHYLFSTGDLYGTRSNLDINFGIFMRQFERIVKNFEIFVQTKRSSWQFLLINRNIIVQSGGCINKYNFPISSQRTQGPFMEFCVLPDPRIAIVKVSRMYVFIRHLWQNDEPFLQKLSPKPVIRASVRKIHH